MRKKRKLIPIREKQIHFRVTQEMFDLICTDAEKAGISISVYCRAQKAGMSISVYCRNAVLNRKIVQRPLVFHDDTALVHELRNLNKLGSNLNQLARYFHEGGLMTNSLARELHHLLGEMDKMVIRCNRELEREYGN